MRARPTVDDAEHARTSRQPLRRTTAAYAHRRLPLPRRRGSDRRPARGKAGVQRRLHDRGVGVQPRGTAARTRHRRRRLARRRAARQRQGTDARPPDASGDRHARCRHRHRPHRRGRPSAERRRRAGDRHDQGRAPTTRDVAKAALAAFEDDERRDRRRLRRLQLQISETVSEDLGRAELLAFPLLVLLALLFFRGRAALLPLVVGVTTVLGTFLVLTGVHQLYGLNIFALNLVIGLGLGLAIDYTLFLVTRFREELGNGTATNGRHRDDDGDRRPDRRVLGADGRRRARHADALPAPLRAVDGHRRCQRRDRRGGRLARRVAGVAGDLGPQAAAERRPARRGHLRPLVPARPRRDAPAGPDRGRDGGPDAPRRAARRWA